MKNLISLILIGISIGWLMGMSVSPVLGIFLTSIIGTMSSLLGVIIGLTQKEKTRGRKNDDLSLEEGKVKKLGFLWSYNPEINLAPLALFVVFLSFGTAFGVISRTNDWLGTTILEKEGETGTQENGKASNSEKEEKTKQLHQYGVLFNDELVNECSNLCTLSGEDFINEMNISGQQFVIAIAKIQIGNLEKEKIIKDICKCSN